MGWNFSIMPVRYYNSPGGGYLSDVLDGARWAVEHGAKCVNVSQTGVEYEPVQTTGEYITSQGGLLFWAAGNDGRDLSWFDWEDVIVVGGTDLDDDRTWCSAYGLAVDLYAPGIDILSTYINGGLGLSGCGTSASVPMAAGIGGLVWSVSPCLSPQQVEQCLFSGCVDLGEPGDDTTWGWGRVNSYSAVLGASPCGDFDGDGDVDLSDFATFALCYAGAAVTTPPPSCAPADFDLTDLDGDGDADLSDFAIFALNYTG